MKLIRSTIIMSFAVIVVLVCQHYASIHASDISIKFSDGLLCVGKNVNERMMTK